MFRRSHDWLLPATSGGQRAIGYEDMAERVAACLGTSTSTSAQQLRIIAILNRVGSHQVVCHQRQFCRANGFT